LTVHHHDDHDHADDASSAQAAEWDARYRERGDAMWSVERHAVEARIDPPPGTPHIADVIVRARRR
jgi:hypothetical protein